MERKVYKELEVSGTCLATEAGISIPSDFLTITSHQNSLPDKLRDSSLLNPLRTLANSLFLVSGTVEFPIALHLFSLVRPRIVFLLLSRWFQDSQYSINFVRISLPL